MEFKKGTSWKYKLQISIDSAILKSKTYDEFLKLMETYNYEIKFGKHIAFRKKGQTRFTRAKTIGADYTESRIKGRISDKNKVHLFTKSNNTKERIINIKNNKKAQASKGYEIWARKYNMKLTAKTLNTLRKYEIKDFSELDILIRSKSEERQRLLSEIKLMEKEMETITKIVESINIINVNAKIYKVYQMNLDNENFYNSYKSSITKYEAANKYLQSINYKKNDIKELSIKFDEINNLKENLMSDYLLLNREINDLYELRKNISAFQNNINEHVYTI